MNSFFITPALNSIFQNLSIVCTTYEMKSIVRHPWPSMVWPQLNFPALTSHCPPSSSYTKVFTLSQMKPESGLYLELPSSLPVYTDDCQFFKAKLTNHFFHMDSPEPPTPSFPDGINLRLARIHIILYLYNNSHRLSLFFSESRLLKGKTVP